MKKKENDKSFANITHNVFNEKINNNKTTLKCGSISDEKNSMYI